MDGAGGSTAIDPGVAPNKGDPTGPADPMGKGPSNPNGPATKGGAQRGPPTAPTGPTGPATRGSGGAFKRATTGSHGDWRTWWNWNSEPYLRAGLRADFATTPGPADLDQIDLAPKLAALLAGNDERDVANGVVALARSTPATQSERIAAVVRTRLDDERVFVRDAVILALGILRDHDAVAPLARILADETSAPCSQRQVAALSLGLIGGAEAEAALLAQLRGRICPDLAAAALLGAAQAAPKSTRVAKHALAILNSGACDTNARACAAAALAKLDGEAGRAALAHLVALVKDPATPGELEASALLALGSLATPADTAATTELLRAAQDGGAPRPRSLALIALGRVLERDADRAANAAARAPLLDLLQKTALRPARHADRGWALLALGFALHGESADSAVRALAAAPLRELVASTAEPDDRAAAAIALGLMRDAQAGDVLVGALTQRPSPRLATALLQGVGMLRSSGAAATVRTVAFDASLRPEVRVEAARALALLGDPDTLPRLARDLATTRDVSEAAVLCASLAKLRTTGAIQPLALQAFGEGRGLETTRRFATAALGELTEGGASASLPYWCAYALDRDVELRAPVLRPLLLE
jgi:HEAT repeat protein